MKRIARIALGALLVVVGLVGMFFTFGPALLADCSADCVARGERAIAVGAGVVMLGVTVAGAWVLHGGTRGRR